MFKYRYLYSKCSCLYTDFLKSSPLKPLCQMNRNLVGSIYGRFSIKIAHFVTIYLQTWPPQAILVSEWSISRNLLLWQLGQMDRKVVGSIHGRSSMGIVHSVLIRYQTWLSKAILVSYWSISKTAFPLKLLGQMIWNLVRSIYGRSSIEIANFVLIH